MIRLAKSYQFYWFPRVRKNRLLWKDKWSTPRCELEPKFELEWLWFSLLILIKDDSFWERWLWLHFYCNSVVDKASTTWGWIDHETNKSTWNDYKLPKWYKIFVYEKL